MMMLMMVIILMAPPLPYQSLLIYPTVPLVGVTGWAVRPTLPTLVGVTVVDSIDGVVVDPTVIGIGRMAVVQRATTRIVPTTPAIPIGGSIMTMMTVMTVTNPSNSSIRPRQSRRSGS